MNKIIFDESEKEVNFIVIDDTNKILEKVYHLNEIKNSYSVLVPNY